MEKHKRRSIVFLMVAIVLAVAAGGSAFMVLDQQWRDLGQMVDVVVAKQPIPARTLLTGDMVETKQIPRKFAQDDYVLSLDQVAGVPAVALVDFAPGDILLTQALDRNAGLKPGMRAVSISVNRKQSVGGAIRPGNRVDVVISYRRATPPPASTEGPIQVSPEAATGEGITKVLFQDVEILGVSSLSSPVSQAEVAKTLQQGQETMAGANLPVMDTGGTRFLPNGQLMDEETVTLGLSLEDAMRLTYMDNFGEEIRLVIRRLDEKESPELPAIDLQTFR